VHLHRSVERFVVVVDSIVKKGYGPYDVQCLFTSGLSSPMDRCSTRLAGNASPGYNGTMNDAFIRHL
jgi:hypothetical protein